MSIIDCVQLPHRRGDHGTASSLQFSVAGRSNPREEGNLSIRLPGWPCSHFPSRLSSAPSFPPPIHSKQRIWSCPTSYFWHLHQIPQSRRSSPRSLFKGFQKPSLRPHKMTQWVHVLATNPGNLSGISGTHTMEGEKETIASCPLTSTHAVVCAHLHTCTHSQMNR